MQIWAVNVVNNCALIKFGADFVSTKLAAFDNVKIKSMTIKS